jgi:hypothetical protein
MIASVARLADAIWRWMENISPKKELKIENAVLGQVDQVSPTGLYYPRHVVMKAFMDRKGPIMGYLRENKQSPSGLSTVDMTKVSHYITDISINNSGQVLGTIVPMAGHEGDKLKKTIQRNPDSLTFGIMSYINAERGSESGPTPGLIVTNMNIVTIDAVRKA